MKFTVTGANKETGDDVELTIIATSQADAEQQATHKGILVSAVKPIDDDSSVAVALVDDDPPADHKAANQRSTHGTITINASNPSDTAHTSDGTHAIAPAHAVAAMEYHILMNQALYLLESAVNKHIAQGWEPQGGICIGVSNNAMQYFQAVVRKKKEPAA